MPADSAKSVSMSGSSAERAARAPLGCITEDIQTANNSADTSTPPQTFEHPTLSQRFCPPYRLSVTRLVSSTHEKQLRVSREKMSRAFHPEASGFRFLMQNPSA